MSDSPLLAELKRSAKQMTNEIGVDWDEIPETIAEATCYDLMFHIFEEIGRDCTASEIAAHLGLLGEDGELTL